MLADGVTLGHAETEDEPRYGAEDAAVELRESFELFGRFAGRVLRVHAIEQRQLQIERVDEVNLVPAFLKLPDDELRSSRWFDRGMMRGNRAMLAVTIGGTEQAYSQEGIYGSAAEVLRPINHGILAFCGFEVVEPFLAFAPARKDEEQRRQIFDAHAQRLVNIALAPTLKMLRSEEYENFVLKQPAARAPSAISR